ncbi:MAG: hypothetical protein P8Z49_00025 [Acidobacteriota bacterium]|jgi:deoxyribose-phosphate aldolase
MAGSASDPSPSAADRVEGALLDPFLSLRACENTLKRWAGNGVRRVVAQPAVLAAVHPELYPDVRFVGVVGYPSGGQTLTSKRVEVLECLRLKASCASVVLAHSLLADMDAVGVRAELKQLLETAPELEMEFIVEWGALDEQSRTWFLRMIKDHRPAAVRAGTGVYTALPSPGTIREVRSRLDRKVALHVLVPDDMIERAGDFIGAGADRIQSSRPEEAIRVLS